MWQIVCDMTPEEVVRCIDFRYITDVVTPEEAVKMLQHAEKGKAARLQEARDNIAVPAYSTSPGWMVLLGEKMREVLDQEIKKGYTVFKFKVGSGVEDDRAKLAAIRDVLGYDNGFQIIIDANQVRLAATGTYGAWTKKVIGLERPGGHRIHETARGV